MSLFTIDDGTRLACGCSRCSASTQLDPTRLPSDAFDATGVDNGRTGNQLIDGLLSGRKWEGVITFSFPQLASVFPSNYGSNEPTNVFGAASLQLMEATRAILGGFTANGTSNVMTYGSFASLVTTGIQQTANNGLNGLGDIRSSLSNSPNTAWAYYPGAEQGGDIWYGRQADFSNPTIGSYSYDTIIHELGHALGLKHSHEAGGVSNVAIPSNRDALEYTVMSYRSHIGAQTTGYTNEIWGYPQTFMMLDILALQTLYGADYTTNNSDTTYTWNPSTGEMSVNGVGQGKPGGNKIFLTIWDGGGTDTYNMLNYTSNVIIKLEPGESSRTSDAQRAKLAGSNIFFAENIYNSLLFQSNLSSIIENAIGGSGQDAIYGNSVSNMLMGHLGNDSLHGFGGPDWLDGGPGFDYAFYDSSPSGVLVRLDAGSSLGGDAQGDILVSIEGVWGSGWNDTLVGSNVAGDSLMGLNGDDFLYGQAQNDQLFGGLGNDQLDGGTGADVLNGSDGFDYARYDNSSSGVLIRLDNGQVLGGDAVGDILLSIEGLVGSAFGDTLVGSNAEVDALLGQAGNDVLYGQGGNDQLYGGSGNDELYGGAGADLLDGGLGFDYARFESSMVGVFVRLDGALSSGGEAEADRLFSIEGVYGSAFGDTLAGSDIESEILIGLDGNDLLLGQAGDDALYGGNGDDNLYGGAGADQHDGGAGFDYARYDQSLAAVFVRLDTGQTFGGDAVGDTFFSIEGLVGSGFGDTLIGSNILSDVLLGQGGDDALYGQAGNDQLLGDGGNDWLFGGEGADQLAGGAGADYMDGGNGFDYARYDQSLAAVFVRLDNGQAFGGDAAGDSFLSIEGLVGSGFGDTLIGSSVLADVLLGQDGDDALYGQGGNDQLNGDNGNDHLYGGAGADRLDGGAGFDYARYDHSSAGVFVRLDNGQVFGGDAVGDTFLSIEGLSGSSLADTLVGFASLADILLGQDGDDVLYGQGGNDTLQGGNGNDQIYGGRGADMLFGGAGYDVFWTASDEMQAGVWDTIADFGESGLNFDYLRFQGRTRSSLHLYDMNGDCVITTSAAGFSGGIIVKNFSTAQIGDQLIFG